VTDTPAPARANPLAVDSFVDTTRIATDVALNALDLHGELARQSGLVYFYTSMAAKAGRQHAMLKLRSDATDAQVATKIRNEANNRLAENGDPDPEKLTAPQVVERIRVHPQTIAIKKALIEAEEVETVLKGVVTALRDKSSSLTSLSLMTRDEIRAKLNAEQEMNEDPSRGQRGNLASLRNR
jgi:hypothetical protein